MNKISFKYRIALTVLMLEVVMVALVLWKSQTVSFDEVSSTLHAQHEIYLDLLSELGRKALVTSEYGELQQYVDKLKKITTINSITVTDHRNVIVVSSDHELLSKVFPAFEDDESGHWDDRAITLESADGTIGRVAIKFSNSGILAAYRKSIVQGISIAGLSMAVIAGAGLMIGHLLVRRLEKLNKAAKKMAEGQLETRACISGSDEVAELCATFNDMAGKMKSSMDSLKQSEQGLQEAQHLAHIGSWQWTVATDAVEWSEELYRINGRDPKLPPPCYAKMASCYTPDSWERLSEAVTQALQHGTAYELDLEIVRPDGTTRHTAARGEAGYDDNGMIVRLQGTVQDITERKLAEEQLSRSLREKEVMLKEIHHRVKNNMQVLVSLLNLQAMRITDSTVRALFEESQNRVWSMALIHEGLYQSKDLACIDFKEYLQALIAGVAETYNRRDVAVAVDMESLTLDVNQGVPCGLIVNELVSNSLKHAFPEGRKGTIRLGININGEGNKVLIVEDDGIGFPPEVDFGNTSTLGLQLVTALAGQLRATIELAESEGTRLSITFPGTLEYNG